MLLLSADKYWKLIGLIDLDITGDLDECSFDGLMEMVIKNLRRMNEHSDTEIRVQTTLQRPFVIEEWGTE